MRKAALATFLFLLSTLPSFAQTADRDRHQSFFSYDDGGTIVKQEDGREVEARVNLPVYPGDEVITNRRGRAELHLSDGNTVGVDRATALRFLSILDSYEGESNQTVASLKYGKVAVYRTRFGRDTLRLDTENASYVATSQAVYSVEADSRGRDQITVFDGNVEVRTRARTTRLREGESAEIDDQGLYDLVTRTTSSADDFERWFLRRTERAGRKSRYLDDDRLAYWADDLDTHGRWVQVGGIGWSWRPHVSVGWRPYYNGYWYQSRIGCLTWVSYDPFGFVPYHYGRWAHDPFYGWVWVPGGGYSPAWVYWAYGPSYVGWAPAGWWDCHRPYYDWAYRPYNRFAHHGFGFYGRVRVNDLDLRPWTFVNPDVLVSTRVDRAALTADLVKQRLGRGGDGFATVSNEPARFTREEFRNPAEAVNRVARRGWGSGTGSTDRGNVASAAPVDMTPFFRRDDNVGSAVRERIARGRGGDNAAPGVAGRTAGGGTGSVAPVDTSGGLAPIGRGSVAPIGGGSVAPIGGGNVAPIGDGTTGRVNRGGTVSGGGNSSSDDTSGNNRPSWRDRVTRGGGERGTVSGGERGTSSGTVGGATDSARETPRAVERPSRGDDSSWRNRRRADTPADDNSASPRGGSTNDSSAGSSDAPRRVIDGIRGARPTPRDSDDGGSRESTRSRGSDSRDSGRSRESAPPPRVERPRSSGGDSGGSGRSSGGDSGARSSGGNSGGGRSSDSGSSSRSNDGGSSSRSNDGGSRSSGGDGGRVKRDH